MLLLLLFNARWALPSTCIRRNGILGEYLTRYYAEITFHPFLTIIITFYHYVFMVQWYSEPDNNEDIHTSMPRGGLHVVGRVVRESEE